MVAFCLCVWATFARGLFDGVTLLAGLCGVYSLGLLLVPTRPRLRLTTTDEQERIVLDLGRKVRPLDLDRIVRGQARASLNEMPDLPKPKVAPDAPFGSIISAGMAAGFVGSLTGVTKEALRKFEGKVAAYGQELSAWLEEVDNARAEYLRLFDIELRLHELGHAPADHVHLRLYFPRGFDLNKDLPRSKEAPARPRWSLNSFASPALVRDLDVTFPAGIRPIHLPGTENARYSVEDGNPVVDYDLGRVNQSDHRNVAAVRMRAPGPGTYTVKWEASATGLSKPQTGELVIAVAEPEEGRAITTLDEAERLRERVCA